ncbi:hypothetical protein [Nitrincola sp.]|uniref:hypothetical protein n=1 Tax=Nitrincola sp. TaxID=1926584 RepID=UPI003A92D3C3
MEDDSEEVDVAPKPLRILKRDDVLSEQLSGPARQIHVGIVLMRQALEDRVTEVLEDSFTLPFQRLMRLKPRKEFIRPVGYELRVGVHSVAVRWYYMVPTGGRDANGKKKFIKKRFDVKTDGSLKLRGVPNITPELKEILEDVHQKILFLNPMSQRLIKLGRSLRECLRTAGNDGACLELTDEEQDILKHGYNPLYECEVAQYIKDVV